MKCVVGLSYGHHEASACLYFEDGRIVYLREEWLSRVKGDFRFPKFSLRYFSKLINQENAELISACLFEKPLKTWLMSGLEKHLSPQNYLSKIRQFRQGDVFFEREIKKIFPHKYEIIYCPHHLSHALTTTAFAPFISEKVIHIVLDGYGDGSSGAIYEGTGSDLEEYSSFEKNASLGLVYSALTEWAGFVPNEDEYKVMALAAFGKAEYEAFILDEVFGYTDDKLWVNEDYFNFIDLGLPTIKNKFCEKFGYINDLMLNANNVRDNVEICNVISSFQSALEKVVEKIISKALLIHPSTEAVLLGGGLFHNSRLVGVLSQKFNKQIFVSPTPGDAGSSIGAAYFAGLCVGFDQINQLSPFCGPKTQSLDDFPLLFRKASKFKNDIDFAKQLLNSGKIFATYSGKCEVGPRALGNRSLCCDARSKKALEHLNEVIKQREGFRPIAPILEKKDFDKIFNAEGLSISSTAWMGQLVWPKEGIDPAQYPFLHKDNSARVQVVDVEKTDNADHVPTVIRECLKESYIIANTSFNIAGDPMVFDIEDCYINCIRLGVEFVLSNDQFYEVVK